MLFANSMIEERPHQLNACNEQEDLVMKQQEDAKRVKWSENSNSEMVNINQRLNTSKSRTTKLKKLENENAILKKRIANMEKLLQFNYKAADEEQLLKNNKFAPIIDNDIEIDEESPQSGNDEVNSSFETVKRAIKRKNVNTHSISRESKNPSPIKHNKVVSETKVSKPPPLHIHNQGINDTIQLVKAAKIENFEIRRVNNYKHSLIINSMDNFDKMQNILKEVNTKYFTFTPKAQKHKTVVLKGLNEEEDMDEIKINIEKHGIKVTNVTQLKTKRSLEKNIKLPLFIIQCSPETEMAKLYNIRSLNYQRISWENLKKQEGIMQCRNCQRFGHAAANCNLDYRCVKCSNQHKPGECKITSTTEKTTFSVSIVIVMDTQHRLKAALHIKMLY